MADLIAVPWWMRRGRLVLAIALAAVLAAASPALPQTAPAIPDLLATAQRQLTGASTSLLAAEAGQEGHWTFANAAGERFTAASPEEMKRVLPTLLPEQDKPPGARLTLVVGEETVFRHRAAYLALPLAQQARVEPFVVVGGALHRLVRRGDTLHAAVRPGLLVEIGERALFDEAVWQLAHPLRRGSVRVIAVEPAGPDTLPATPRIDPQTSRPLTDQIAPTSLPSALRTLRGQTVILTARRDGSLLAFRPASGPELTLPAAEVLAAAEAGDVNLVVLQSATPRQPGARSWLWQRVSVTRLEDAIARDHLADFLNALATPESRLLVATTSAAPGRILLTATPLRADAGARGAIAETWNDVVSSIAGQVVVTGVEASLRDRARQTELDRRLVPWLPSWLQLVYGGLLALGLLGHPTAGRWWSGLWPPEQREGYGGAFGFLSARTIRALAYAAVFMPLVGPVSASVTLAGLLKGRRSQA